MLLGLVDRLAETAKGASAAHWGGASEGGLLRLLDEAGVDFVHKARTLAEGEVAVTVALLGVAQSEFRHGTGDGHVEQAAFFLQFLAGAEAENAREEVFFHTDNVDVGELQTLRAVYGHQADVVVVAVVFFHLVVGEQGDVFHKLHQVDAGGLAGGLVHLSVAEFHDGVEQLLHVLHP